MNESESGLKDKTAGYREEEVKLQPPAAPAVTLSNPSDSFFDPHLDHSETIFTFELEK
jgi:hypothetical protein